MNQEEYNLYWDTYSDHLREMLHEMMKSDQLTDVTLVCDDKRQFKTHKIILSACSTVFKSIINDLPQNSSVIYLRGIQHQEMESILEFMYLGAVTFKQERMNEFLNVAKNLEIKEISRDVKLEEENACKEETWFSETENVIKTEVVNVPQTKPNEDGNKSIERNTHLMSQLQSQKNKEGLFVCDQCLSQFKRKDHLNVHTQSKHEGLKYDCNQCDQQFTLQRNLTAHIQYKHENVKYACKQCDQQFTQPHSLTVHIQSIHEGVKYACNQCHQKFTQKDNMNLHIQSKHEGVKYACNQCEQRFTLQRNLTAHIQYKHKGVKYSCMYCDYQATTQSHLKRHSKSKHNKCIK